MAVAPVVVGTAAAIGVEPRFHWPAAVMALSVSLLLQIGANYANDYAD